MAVQAQNTTIALMAARMGDGSLKSPMVAGGEVSPQALEIMDAKLEATSRSIAALEHRMGACVSDVALHDAMRDHTGMVRQLVLDLCTSLNGDVQQLVKDAVTGVIETMMGSLQTLLQNFVLKSEQSKLMERLDKFETAFNDRGCCPSLEESVPPSRSNFVNESGVPLEDVAPLSGGDL